MQAFCSPFVRAFSPVNPRNEKIFSREPLLAELYFSLFSVKRDY